MDTTQWPQELGLVKPIEEMMAGVGGGGGATSAVPGASRAPAQLVERRARPQKEKALNCPRCNSTNTKFCYYNNYSLTQPRYFCKTCRRYWTEGGSLRNVPVGGGSRKNKRSSSSAPSTPFSTTTTTTNTSTITATANNNSNKKLMTHDISLSSPSHNIKFSQSQDLNLAFPYHSMPHEYTEFPNSSSCNTTTTNINTTGNSRSNPYTANSTVGAFSAMELLRSTGMSSSRGVGSFVHMPLQEYPSGLGFLHDFRPPTTLGFPLDHGVGGGGGGEDHGGEVATAVGGTGNYESSLQESRLLFPFEDLKPAVPSNSGELEHNRMQSGDPPGFWNGMIHGGGGSW